MFVIFFLSIYVWCFTFLFYLNGIFSGCPLTAHVLPTTTHLFITCIILHICLYLLSTLLPTPLISYSINLQHAHHLLLLNFVFIFVYPYELGGIFLSPLGFIYLYQAICIVTGYLVYIHTLLVLTTYGQTTTPCVLDLIFLQLFILARLAAQFSFVN